MIRVSCLGGVGSVTGSSYLVESSTGKKVLVDCGLFQGGRQMEDRNWLDWGFDPKQIQTLFLTHAHIDHSGRIPKLVKDGFRGKIITSPPTAELCQIMLLDGAHIQEMDAEWRSRKNRRQGKKDLSPLYTTEDAEESLTLFSPVERDRIIQAEEGIRARLRNAGHILGSSILELWLEESHGAIKIVFSGDLGKKDQLIVRDPFEIFDADYLFLESTYGTVCIGPQRKVRKSCLRRSVMASPMMKRSLSLPSPSRGHKRSFIFSGNFTGKAPSPLFPFISIAL
ncbi:MAG: MBL fold metallo-hydrolase [Pseudomonadota bacterium]